MRPVDVIAGALGASTSAEVGGELVTEVYRPEGLAYLILQRLRDAGWAVVPAFDRPDDRCPSCGHIGMNHGTPGSLGCTVRMVWKDGHEGYCPCPSTYRPEAS